MFFFTAEKSAPLVLGKRRSEDFNKPLNQSDSSKMENIEESDDRAESDNKCHNPRIGNNGLSFGLIH